MSFRNDIPWCLLYSHYIPLISPYSPIVIPIICCSNTLSITIYSDALKLRMRFWKRRAAKKTLLIAKKWQEGLFLPRFVSRGHLSNGDLRMRGHWIVYHISVLLSWFRKYAVNCILSCICASSGVIFLFAVFWTL